MAFFSPPGNRTVVFGRDEQDRIDSGECAFQRLGDRRIIRVIVLAVERQILEGDFGEVKLGWCDFLQWPSRAAD